MFGLKVNMRRRLMCNCCARRVAFSGCLVRTASGGKHFSDLEGVLPGRMFRSIWFSFLPFLSPLPFLKAFHFSCYPLPSFLSSKVQFLWFFSVPCTCKSISYVMQDFRSAVMETEGEEGEPALEEQRLGEILGVLPQVYALHTSILTELEERISQW